jgi:hypothetical protein
MVEHYTGTEKDVKFAGKPAGELMHIQNSGILRYETMGYERSGGNLPSSPEGRLRRERDWPVAAERQQALPAGPSMPMLGRPRR